MKIKKAFIFTGGMAVGYTLCCGMVIKKGLKAIDVLLNALNSVIEDSKQNELPEDLKKEFTHLSHSLIFFNSNRAIKVLEEMNRKIIKYGFISINDIYFILYDLFDDSVEPISDSIANDYGWTEDDIDSIYTNTRGLGAYIVMPKPRKKADCV